MRRRHTVRFGLMVLGPVLILLGLAPPASAVQLVTPYPAIRVEAGETTTLDLQLHSTVRESVALRVTEAPDGWQTVFRGDGREVDAAYTSPDSDEPAEVQLDVRIPDDVRPGTYRVTVAATARSGNATLPLQLRVVDQAADAFELTTDFPTLRGSGSDTFRFDLTLANHTAQEATFALSATGPEGWNVTASPSSEQQAATASVEGGGTSTVTVEADPPDNVPAGSYDIAVQATGSGATLTTDLTAEVTGEASFTLTTADERLNASGNAGDTGTLTLVVRNDGNAALQNVELSSTPPKNWDVSFEPSTVDAIAPGEQAEVTARITPTGDAIAGDYVVTLTANADGASQDVEIRYAVETSGWWGLVGILVIAAAVGGLVWVYRRYGRR